MARMRTVFWTLGASVAHIMAEGCTPEQASTGFDYLIFQTACGRFVRVKLVDMGHRGWEDIREQCVRRVWDLDKLREDGHYALTVREALFGNGHFDKTADLCRRCFQREVVKYNREEHCV